MTIISNGFSNKTSQNLITRDAKVSLQLCLAAISKTEATAFIIRV